MPLGTNGEFELFYRFNQSTDQVAQGYLRRWSEDAPKYAWWLCGELAGLRRYRDAELLKTRHPMVYGWAEKLLSEMVRPATRKNKNDE